MRMADRQAIARPPARVHRGERLKADTVNRLIDAIFRPAVRTNRIPYNPGRTQPPELWDLYAKGHNEWKIKTDLVTAGGLYLSSKMIASIAVDGVTLDASGDFWTSGTITDDSKQACFVTVNRRTTVVTLHADEEFPDGTDPEYVYTEVMPLWWFKWTEVTTPGEPYYSDGGYISEYMSMRHVFRTPTMA